MALNKDWKDLPAVLAPTAGETLAEWHARIDAYAVANPGVLTPLDAAGMEDVEARVQAEIDAKMPVDVASYGTDSPAITQAITAAGVDGGLYFRGGTYTLTARHTLLSGQSVTFAEGVVFSCQASPSTSPNSYFYAAGSEEAKQNLGVDALEGATTLTLPTGAGASFAPGNCIGLDSTAIAITTYRVGEMHKIISIAGDVLTLDAPLEWAYRVADTAKFWRINLLRPITWGPGALFISTNPTVNTGYAIDFRRVDRPQVDVALENMSGGILIYDSPDGRVNATVDRLPNYANAYGYGVAAAGFTRNLTVHVVGRGTRHLFTTLAGGSDSLSGGPLHVTVSGIGEANPGCFAIWDTHAPGRHILFDGCIARGAADVGVPNFQIRNHYTTLADCDSHRGSRGVAVVAGAKWTRIVGGRYAWADKEGITDAGDSTSIIGVEVTDSGKNGINNTSGPNALIKACHVTRNGRLTTGSIGILATAASPTIEDNIVPFTYVSPAGQYQGISTSATAWVKGNTLRGYTNRTWPVVAAAGAIRERNFTGAIPTVTAAAAIDVETEDILKISGATIIDTINKGTLGREITLLFTTAGGASDGVGNLRLVSALTAAINTTLTLVHDGTNWLEKARSVN